MTDAVVQLLRPGQGPARGAFARSLQDRVGPALDFLDPPPADREAWRRVVAQRAEVAPRCSPGLVTALARTQERLDGGPRAAANLQALASGMPVLAVVTGQQPGLFGGPLLTFHKVAGAIHLANALDGLAGIRVVPVFWAATEDHDLEEAGRATVLDRSGTPRGIQLDARNDGRSIGHRSFPAPALDALFEALGAALPDTDRAREALALARRESDDDFGHWSLRCLVRLFGDSGLVVADPLTFPAEAAPVFDHLLEHARGIDAAVRDCGQALQRAGLPAPLAFDEGTAPLFVREEPAGPRLRVHVGADDRASLRGRPAEDLATLRARVRATPALASGDVVGRVFVQNALFPVLAYVAGPTEIAYQAQVRRAHQALGLPFPLALPRPHATWVEAKTARRAAQFDRTIAALLKERPDAPPGGSEPADVFDALQAHLTSWPDAVRDALARKGAGPDALARALERLHAAWEKSEPRVRAGFAADAGRGPVQWARLMNVLRPRNRPQDRVLSPFSLVARHGVSAVRAGLAKLDPLAAGHYLVHPEGSDV